MSSWSLKTPVAFLIFNRPDTTQRVFNEIAKAKPAKLLVVADGPRAKKHGEKELCHQTREILKQVDWDCEVLTNYSDTNLGCKYRVSSGLDWLFKQVPEAIILEDDCLPDPVFFRYCEEMLERYRNDERVGMITGDNFQNGTWRGDGSYYFSRYCNIWGWASWRRAWKDYDVEMSAWPHKRQEGWLQEIFENEKEAEYWDMIFEAVRKDKVITWDYQWLFTNLGKDRLTVVPNKNLISNIGFDMRATHTKKPSAYANIPTSSLEFPLTHPPSVTSHIEADRYVAMTKQTSSRLRKTYNMIKGLRKYLFR